MKQVIISPVSIKIPYFVSFESYSRHVIEVPQMFLSCCGSFQQCSFPQACVHKGRGHKMKGRSICLDKLPDSKRNEGV